MLKKLTLNLLDLVANSILLYIYHNFKYHRNTTTSILISNVNTHIIKIEIGSVQNTLASRQIQLNVLNQIVNSEIHYYFSD